MNPQYAEVSRILGQSESDRQLSLLSKALHEQLPSLKQNADFDNATKLGQNTNDYLVLAEEFRLFEKICRLKKTMHMVTCR